MQITEGDAGKSWGRCQMEIQSRVPHNSFSKFTLSSNSRQFIIVSAFGFYSIFPCWFVPCINAAIMSLSVMKISAQIWSRDSLVTTLLAL